MRREDARARRVAIVADVLINPGSAFYAGLGACPGPVLEVLSEDGWGIMKAPPHLLGEDAMASSLATIAGDAADYLKHGHLVLVLGAGGLPEGGLRLDLLAGAFRELGADHPEVITFGLDEACPAAAIRDRLAGATPPGGGQAASNARDRVPTATP